MINITNEAKKRIVMDSDGSLPSYAWPGGYPLCYWDSDGMVLCPTCANNNDEFSAPIAAHDVNWEDSALYCDHCSKRIESAYAED